jgi:hypothetical protein
LETTSKLKIEQMAGQSSADEELEKILQRLLPE